MTFAEVASGDSQQFNGPIWGVRVLSAGNGAGAYLDSTKVPTETVLLTLRAPKGRPYDRLVMKGPILIQIAETPDDDLTADARLQEVGPLREWTADAVNPVLIQPAPAQVWQPSFTVPRGAKSALLMGSNAAGAAAFVNGIEFWDSAGNLVVPLNDVVPNTGASAIAAATNYKKPVAAFGLGHAPSTAAYVGANLNAAIMFPFPPPSGRIVVAVASAAGPGIAAGMVALRMAWW